MATTKVSELTALTSAPDSDDFLPIVDNSASETKKISVYDLFQFTNVAFDSAINATNAIYALRADSATDARFAIIATRALATDSADNATNAILARRADTADSAVNATFANYALRSFSSDSADRATSSIFAVRSTYADSAMNAASADNALRAISADSATFSSISVFASSAANAGLAAAALYTTDSARLWFDSSPPSTVDSALDRLALVIRTLNGGVGA